MISIKNYNFYIFNFIFCFFPISLILGNQATNLNLALICFYALLLYPKKIFLINFNFFDKLLILFFLYSLIVLLINYAEYSFFLNSNIFPKLIIHKTIFYFRYLILYFVLRFLLNEKILKIKYFYLICALSVTTVSIDIIIQFIFGKNIIGLTPYTNKHYSGLFGNELIAGGYILKFYSTLLIIILPILLNFKKNNFLIYIFLILFFLFAIILSGNRMPLILYLLSIIFFLFLFKNYRKYFIKFFLIISLFLIILLNINHKFKENYLTFYFYSKKLIEVFVASDLKNPTNDMLTLPYMGEFYCAKIMIGKNPVIGGGIRSYRTHDNGCNTHPHNYYLEIISELGVLGLIMILVFVYSLLFNSIKLYPKYSFQVIPPVIFILIEFFPIRSSGSFFSTNNASIIFIFFAILVSLIVNKSNKV